MKKYIVLNLGFILFLILVLWACNTPQINDYPDIQYPHYEVKARDLEMIELINEYRDENNISRLVFNQYVCDVSASHSNYMADNEVCNHFYFEYREHAFPERNLTESVGFGFSTSNALLHALKESPRHNQMLLDNDYYIIGVASKTGHDNKVYVTIEFVR